MKSPQEIRNLIKERDQVLFDLVSSVSDQDLLDNFGPILKYLNQDKAEHHQIKFFVLEGRLDWAYVPASKEAKQLEKISKLRENFIIGYENYFDHLLTMNDVRKAPERMKLLKLLKKVSVEFDEHPKGLWVYGKSGLGKTHILKSFSNYMALKGNITSYLFVPEMITILKSFIQVPNSINEINSFLEKAKHSDFLVIDDMTSVNIGPWIRDTFLFPLLDFRSKQKKLTIFISNGNKKDFKRRIEMKETPRSDKAVADKLISRINDLAVEIELK